MAFQAQLAVLAVLLSFVLQALAQEPAAPSPPAVPVTPLPKPGPSAVDQRTMAAARRFVCAPFCRFRLCDIDNGAFVQRQKGADLFLAQPRVASLPAICRPRFGPSGIGRVTGFGEAMVQMGRRNFVPISEFMTDTISPPFSPTFFRARNIRFPRVARRTGISSRAYRGNQDISDIEGRCMFLPIEGWERIRRDGSVGPVVTASSRSDCVSFRPGATPQVVISFAWDTTDDLDVAVEEPNGNVISFTNPVSSTGGMLLEDILQGDCEGNGLRNSEETIEWPSDAEPLRGEYTVTLTHFSTCGILPSATTLMVRVGDEVILTREEPSSIDVSENGDGRVIEVYRFTLTS